MPRFVKRWWGEITLSRRRTVFSYNLAILIILFGVAFVYHAVPEIYSGFRTSIGPPKVYAFEKYRMFITAMWFGALGGVVISLKGVYDNACEPAWSNCYNLWHLGGHLAAR